jgi:hypothetical protein
MKQLPVLLFLGLVLSLCNLGDKLKTGDKSTGSGKSASSDSGGAAEKATPTAAQTQALVGGTTANWENQGMSWTVPPNWKETSKESKSLLWRSPGGGDAANLIVSISPMDESFPVDSANQASFDGQKTRFKNGEVDELKWLEIDGLKGVQFRESDPEKPDGIRRLQWLAYRKYAGQVQGINVMLSTSGKDFLRHQDAMYGVLYSTKVAH